MIIFEVAWDQCWSGIVFFRYHSGIYNEYFTFFDINRVWVFDGILVFDTIGVCIPCKIAQVSICFRMGWTQIITEVLKDAYLDILTNFQRLSGIASLVPMGRFFGSIIDVDD